MNSVDTTDVRLVVYEILNNGVENVKFTFVYESNKLSYVTQSLKTNFI